MKTLDEILETLRQVLPELKNKYNITKMGVFGSYARGEQTADSDIDILINFDNEDFSYFDLMDIERNLAEIFNNKVDLLMEAEIKPRIKPYVMEDIVYL